MTLGLAPKQADLLRTTAAYCDGRVAPDSIYGILHRECFRLFPDEMFADLFTDVGRRSVPPMIVAVVMVLQRHRGLSDREAVDRFTFDARWKYAAGGLDFDYPGFVHTVLVDMRARLAALGSAGPDLRGDAGRRPSRRGWSGGRRVLDSTPLYDAVATMDTVTLVRSAIRGLLGSPTASWRPSCGRCLPATTTMPPRASRPVTTTMRPPGRRWSTRWPATHTRAAWCWTAGSWPGAWTRPRRCWPRVVGQDLDRTRRACSGSPAGSPRTGSISTVDPEARHGHKTSARGFDGYKGHVAIDPDSRDHHRDRGHRRATSATPTRRPTAHRRSALSRPNPDRGRGRGRCRGTATRTLDRRRR